MSSRRDPKKLCCHCLGVTYGKLEETIRAHDCKSVQEVTLLCRAGGGCRSCHPDIEQVIQQLRSERLAARGGGLRSLIARLFLGKDAS